MDSKEKNRRTIFVNAYVEVPLYFYTKVEKKACEGGAGYVQRPLKQLFCVPLKRRC